MYRPLNFNLKQKYEQRPKSNKRRKLDTDNERANLHISRAFAVDKVNRSHSCLEALVTALAGLRLRFPSLSQSFK